MSNLCDYQLFDLLDVKKLLGNPSSSVNEIFDIIAEKVMCEYQISKNGINYDILEVEFYYFDKNHKDIITYPRTIECGRWFFHASGIDVSFRSICEEKFSKSGDAKENFFGGILIRSLLKNGKEVISGPLKCSWELFDSFNAFAFSPEEFPVITEKTDINRPSVYKTTRWIPYKKDSAESRYKQNYNSFIEFLSYPYRYYIKHPEWINSKASNYNTQPWNSGKEEILILNHC